MSEPQNEPRPSRPLSEISHLFLSTLRDQAGGPNRAKPVRLPPGQREPIAASNNDQLGDIEDSMPTERKRITGIVSAHLDGQLSEATLAYAASLASNGERIGIMTVDAAEFRLQLVECDSDIPASEPEVSDHFDARSMTDAVRELNVDVDRWLLVIGDRRRLEGRSLLNRVDDWTMLTTCDHDGIVAGYRTLKGLAEGAKSPLAIALLDAPGHEQSSRAFEKLAGVCRQFLDWDVTHELLEADVENAQAHTVLWCHTPKGQPEMATGPQWQVVQDFVELTPDATANAAHYGQQIVSEITDADDELDEAMAMMADDAGAPTQPTWQPVAQVTTQLMTDLNLNAEKPTMSMPTFANLNSGSTQGLSGSTGPLKRPCPAGNAAPVQEDGDVIELPDGVSVLSVIVRQGNELLATPIAPPMCPGAMVAVGRDRNLVLVAEAGLHLAGMDAISAAVKWLDDSKQLIAMAMPQLAIDAARPTMVQVLIDYADRTAEGLRPLLGNSRITIRTYRRLRWAGRTGLLLDAA